MNLQLLPLNKRVVSYFIVDHCLYLIKNNIFIIKITLETLQASLGSY